ncbi:3-carboxy-cis,cis-muconate cycloisomerase [Actibacterium sp. MT2.3-13A]|uniref:3-carboxy-cis,cis-muconate cycloisomerase n=1 Tax=Actibacterium sp. MT2.3-13A TaxID=2828332 RepID=UPI001BA56699|nr:3-carboxy-cis,cis-muconate cycloisomerase [Actibacterium sp. MT2.3-13A]
MGPDPFTHPWLGGLFADEEVAAPLSAQAQLAAMRRVEAAYSRALGTAGVVEAGLAERAAAAIEAATFDMAALRAGTARDGVVVPDLVKQLKAQAEATLHPAIHRGLTSQDVTDSALVLALKDLLPLFDARLAALEAALEALIAEHGDAPLMGRTRMQAALPVTVADRVESWRAPLADHRARLAEMTPRLMRLQFGGAVGTRHVLGGKGDAVAAALAAALALGNPPKAWHAMRDGLGELASWLSLVAGTLGKIGQDMALMAQQGIDEIRLSGGGGSSAMPHKQNPVRAELLVTLARYTATLLPGMHHALVHEQERSGTGWALEWLVLPQMLIATGRALAVAGETVAAIERIGSPAP